MKLGHIIYKVDNLDEAVEKYIKKGFRVEYGKKKNPYNALIYFSQGPYFELLQNTGMSPFIKKILKFFGKKALIHKIDTWDNSQEGLIAVALENNRFDVDIEQKILDNANLKYIKLRPKRTDIKGRKLRFLGIMPYDMQIPFFGAKFNIDVRPEENYVHPNGIKGIKSISFGTKKEFIPIINQLCDDEGLKLFIGEGVKDLEFEYVQ